MFQRIIRNALALLPALAMMLPALPAAAAGGGSAAVLAPGYSERLDYPLPTPGSYALPPLGSAGDGEVMDSRALPLQLHALLRGRITVLSFIYTTCDDVNGCPLAIAVLHRLSAALERDPELARKVQLYSLSFDPEHDTPESLRAFDSEHGGHDHMDHGQMTGDHAAHDHHDGMQHAGMAMAPKVPLRFLTTASEAKLAPILKAYGQPVQREVGPDGKPTGRFSHILRVFLIDPELRVRNIYSVSFLHPDLLLNDVRTLLAEEVQAAPPAAATARAGDDRSGYHAADYTTRSLSLAARRGQPLDLTALVAKPPLGLPAVPVPADSPVTAERVALGRKLFFDRRLSLNGTFSCAMCHIPEQGFTSNELATAVGLEGRTVRRNSPSLFNVAYEKSLFHDGRESRLEQQVWQPMLAHNEMANPSVGFVVDRLSGLPDYAGLFEAAFDGRGPGMETVGMALASYERTLLAAGSAFDRWRYGGDADALSPAARRGYALFTGKAGCSGCHQVGEQTALFTDQALHNTGIGYRASMAPEPDRRTVQLAPGEFVEVASDLIRRVGERPPGDLGRYEITQDPADRWKYKTPSLRNVALTAPYMHDGSLATLREVVAFYNGGGVANPLLDPRIHPLGLSDGEVADLVAFLESLTGGNVEALVADAFAAPVGDPGRTVADR